MPNIITIDFEPCLPTPLNGYRFFYRVLGSVGAYTDAGLFASSPAIFEALSGVEDDQYEGYFHSDCGEGVIGDQIPFETEEPPVECRVWVNNNDFNITISYIDCNGVLQEGVTLTPTSQVCAQEITAQDEGTILDDGPCSQSHITVDNDVAFEDVTGINIGPVGIDESPDTLPVTLGEFKQFTSTQIGTFSVEIFTSGVVVTGTIRIIDSLGTVQNLPLSGSASYVFAGVVVNATTDVQVLLLP